MIQISAVAAADVADELKQQYIEEATAPLDGMWLCGFVPAADHYVFHDESESVGYCCVNDQGYLLQFYLRRPWRNQSSSLLASLVRGEDSPLGRVTGAFVSTAEPDYLSLCFDCFPTFSVNALMYELDPAVKAAEWTSGDDTLPMKPVGMAELPQAVEFAVSAIGAPADWLESYYSGLIDRAELFGLWEGGRLLATGESRASHPCQAGYVDVGVVVAESARGHGLATRVLRHLAATNAAKGLLSICSTEVTNIAAQTAIARAGFISRNRIIRFDA